MIPRAESTPTWTPAEVRAWVARHGGNVTAMARRLRVGRTRLQDWMGEAQSSRDLPPYVQAHMETLDELATLREAHDARASGAGRPAR